MQAQTTEEARNFFGLGFQPGLAMTLPSLSRSIRMICLMPTPQFGGGDERAGSMESAGDDLNDRSEPETLCVALRSHRPREHHAVCR